MKLKALTAVIATVVAGHAFALAPTVTPDIEIYQSGASAQQNTMQSLLSSYCKAGTLNTYKSSTSSDKWRNYFCEFKATGVPASLANKKVLFSTRAAGGSGWGVVPVGKNSNVKFMDMDACVAAYTGAATTVCSITIESGAATVGSDHECPLDSANYSALDQHTRCRVSSFGVSDVEPDLFVGNNLPAPFTSGLTTAEAASLTVVSNYGVVFGVSVSNNVRDALIDAGYKVENTGPHSVGGFSANLIKAAIRSLMSGAITNWGQLDPALATVAGGGYMKACRREVGSGTQAAAQIEYLDDPCHTGKKGGNVSMVTAGNTDEGNGYFVVENSASGGVETCQSTAHLATNPDLGGLPFELGAWGINAINRSNTDSGDHWSFVAVDGIFPTVAAAKAGDYDNVYEQTTQFKTSLISGGGPVADFVSLFASQFQAEANIIASGATGVVAIPGVSGNTYNAASGIVGRVTRGGNSCASMQIVQ